MVNLRTTEPVGSISIQISLQSYNPACHSDRLRLTVSSLGHVHLCLCSVIAPLNHNVTASHMHTTLTWQASVEGDVLQSIQNRMCQLQFKFLISDLSILLFDGYLYRTITAAFIHLQQETGQFRPAVSCQPETAWGPNKNRLRWAGPSTLIGRGTLI